ncbi:type IV secretion system protein [Bartonella sp. AP58NXGY]|uniref:type IV secretion system protein n=1 Tax=Bartonella sp. AP58NXGY TaxID=3243498 RepID=UPI0035D043D3
MIIAFGLPNLALAFQWGHHPNPNAFKKNPPPPLPKEYLELIELLKEQIDLIGREILFAEDIHKALTKDKINDHRKVDYTNFFLKNPESIYDENERSNELYKQILENEERIFGNPKQMGPALFARLQHMSALDKAVTLQTFQAAENRSRYIVALLDALDQADNVKKILDVQTIVEGTLTMIKNESIKLQMVAHLRDAERALTKMYKRKMDMKAFNSTNKDMPRIRF